MGIRPENMSVAEKISAMEMLWNDLCERNQVVSPLWHADVLDTRDQARDAGLQEPQDWETSKDEIRLSSK